MNRKPGISCNHRFCTPPVRFKRRHSHPLRRVYKRKTFPICVFQRYCGVLSDKFIKFILKMINKNSFRIRIYKGRPPSSIQILSISQLVDSRCVSALNSSSCYLRRLQHTWELFRLNFRLFLALF